MTPLPPDAIRARKRPLSILYVYLAELVWALVVATPVHAWAGRAWGNHPDGDAVLWLPGGRQLLVWLGQDDAAISVVSRTSIVLLVAGVIAMQVPLGALLASLAFSRGDEDAPRLSPRWQAAMRVGVTAFMPLAGLLALASVVGVLLFLAGGIASSAADHALSTSLGDARSFVVRLVVLALFAVLGALIGVIVDLARAAVARDIGIGIAAGTTTAGWTTMLRGIRMAFGVARRHLWSAALAAVLIALGMAASQALGGRGGGSLILLWLAHQAIVLLRVALRASWLARALALVTPAPPPPDPSA